MRETQDNQLKLGKMTSKEIAEWFGITYESYRHVAKKKLEILKHFADFEIVYGGINITKIKCPYYIKNYKDIELYKQKVEETDNGITTLKGMTKVLKDKDKNEDFLKLKDETAWHRLSKAGAIGYGICNDDASEGIFGKRKRIWVVKLDEYNHFRYMTKEEHKIFKEVLHNFYSDNFDNILLDFIKLDYNEDKEVLKEEIRYLQEDKYDFPAVLGVIEDKIGYKLVKATVHEKK